MYHPNRHPKHIVIVGGGTTGWLTACMVSHYLIKRRHLNATVTLIESPEAATLKTGEGSWPTMRQTLRLIGVQEDVFLRRCRASFKQGTRLIGWRDPQHTFDHPFEVHASFKSRSALLSASYADEPFCRLVSCQPNVIDRNLAPKRVSDAPYQGALNYGYHLDSTELSQLLSEHAQTALRVQHVIGDVEHVLTDIRGNLSALRTRSGQEVSGTFFIDCSGAQGRLIKRHFKTRWRSLKGSLFNNTMITAHAPYLRYEQPILSATYATAWEDGWIWDINMSHKREVGVVYCEEFCNEERARRRLESYLFQSCGLSLGGARSVETQKLHFESGYYETPWVKNCVAIGAAAGMIEPLESSALGLVERCALRVAKALTIQQIDLARAAEEYNEELTEAWRELTLFLKLPFALSRREERYWRIHQNRTTWPEELSALFSSAGAALSGELSQLRGSLFSTQSYLSVAHGMGAVPLERSSKAKGSPYQDLLKVKLRDEMSLCRELPSNRALLKRYKR